MITTRGFTGRRHQADPKRVPPGQSVTDDFPVLSAGPTPHTPFDSWSLTLEDSESLIAEWTWDEVQALPQTELTVDIHCVTKWSKLGTVWSGVTIDDLLAAAGVADPSPYLMAQCDGDYTTNLPLEDLIDGKGLVATKFGGEPLAPEHGGPARLLVPHLYFWKSAKWLSSLRFMEYDEPGFWESLGYHNYGDPWREQRYAGD